MKQDRDAHDIWSALAESWNIFHLRKPYGGAQERKIKKQWESVLGEERVLEIPEPERAVDLALGLIACSWGHYDDFEANMGARQSTKKVREISRQLADLDLESIA